MFSRCTVLADSKKTNLEVATMRGAGVCSNFSNKKGEVGELGGRRGGEGCFKKGGYHLFLY